MRIVVDVDDTVLDLLPVWVSLYNQTYGDDVRVESITEWNLTKFTKNNSGDIYKVLEDPMLYEEVQPVLGAVQAVQHLRGQGHQIVFATVRDHPNKVTCLRKYGFVRSATVSLEYFVVGDKSWLDSDVIIDDNPEYLRKHKGVKLLFDAGHNRNVTIPGVTRVHTWTEIVSYIDTLSETPGCVVSGIGKNAPVIVNNNGGKQSHLGFRFDLMDPVTLFAMAKVLYEGAEKYGENNWRRISTEEHLNHLLGHVYGYLAGDVTDDHLAHAFTRAMFALSMHLTPGDAPWLPIKDVK